MGTIEKAISRREVLKAQWKSLYGREAPGGIPTSLMELALAYRLQEKARGGLKPALRRLLLESGNPKSGSNPMKQRATLKPGTILVREWQGVRHTVNVLDEGVTFKGKLYRSLTQVAQVITGTHRSGPGFFGLDAKRGPRHD